jgi:hypothetical protein
MNLWKLWIARHCCHRLCVVVSRHFGDVRRGGRVSAEDDGGVICVRR